MTHSLPEPHGNPPIDVHKPAWHVPIKNKDTWIGVLGDHTWVTDSHGWGYSMTTEETETFARALLASVQHHQSRKS